MSEDLEAKVWGVFYSLGLDIARLEKTGLRSEAKALFRASEKFSAAEKAAFEEGFEEVLGERLG